MAKSNKVTVEARVTDVLRLTLAGAEFGDIEQYASEQGWNVCERQIRRYIETAHQRFAEMTKRDREQLLGRHLMQRRALYARAMKANDLRTALQVLRDEANLEGLYPPTKVAPTTPDGKHPYHSAAFGGVRREERVTKLLLAEAGDDFSGRRLVEQASPYVSYVLPDTSFPVLMLNVAAMTHVIEQLDAMAMAVNAALHVVLNDEDPMWLDMSQLHAHRFRVQRDAWALFSDGLSGVGDHLVKGNYDGHALEMYGDKICGLAPSEEQLEAIAERWDFDVDDLPTVEDDYASWRALVRPMRL